MSSRVVRLFACSGVTELGAAVVLVSAFTARAQAPDESEIGRWDTIGPCLEPLGGTNSGLLLPDGRLMYCHDTLEPVLFDPVTGTQELGPKSQKEQGCHAVGLLLDGRAIFVAGADLPVSGPGTRQVKTYDPAAEKWTVQSDLTDDRWYPSMVPLTDGGFLVCGGGGLLNPVRTRTSEVMDPATLQWSAAGDLAIGNEVSPIVLLYSGEVLMTHRPPQLYDPATRQWRLAAPFSQGARTPDGRHADHELVLLPDGRVLAIGFDSYDLQNPGTLLEIYDPVTNRWTLGAHQAPARKQPSTVMLPDGKVLVIGGEKLDPGDPTPTNAWGFMSLVDQYDPGTNTWKRLAPTNVVHEYHATPILVPDGRVIIVGGEAQPGSPPPQSVIEAFSPPYLFQGTRPAIRNLSKTSLVRGDTLEFDVADVASALKVVMLGTVASTHFMDSGNGRFLELEFTRTGDHVCASVPQTAASAVFGHYMLFAVSGGVPSVGRIVRIGPGSPAAGDCESPPPPPPDTPTLAARAIRLASSNANAARGRASLTATLDLGPDSAYPPANATLTVGGVEIEIPSFERHRTGFRFRSPDVMVLLVPSPAASSKASLVIRMKGAAVAGIPSQGPLDLVFETGSVTAASRVVLSDGRYDERSAGTTLVAPDTFLASARFRVDGAGRDSIKLAVGVAGLGALPAQAPDVTIDLGDRLAQTVAGGEFRRRGSTLRYRGRTGALTSILVDFRRGRVSVRGTGLDLGAFPSGPVTVEVGTRVGGADRRTIVRMVREGRAVRY